MLAWVSFVMASNKNLDFNEKFLQALDLIEQGKNVFITGRAGTGKSTLLNYIRQKIDKQIVVLAPTGVAAVNIKGQTIHSFFGFKPDTTWDKIKKRYDPEDEDNIYAKLDAIIIDEVSMVRADLLDFVNKFLLLNTGNKDQVFGGIQMIFMGDLYQLPPVLTGAEKKAFGKYYAGPYFFNSKVLEDNRCEMELVELEKIYRQRDDRFVNFLNKVRNNSITEEQINEINHRCYKPDFMPSAYDFYVHLTPTHKAAQQINNFYLNQLDAEEYYFPGYIKGSFEKKNLPAESELAVKIGAQVMLVNNDKSGRWINGTIARVVDVEESEDKEEPDSILVKLPDGGIEPVAPHTWYMYNFYFDSKKEVVKSETVGSFTQYPIRLAWAVTIHKAQGKTFDKMVLDVGRGTFAHGQMYVALSRCVSLEGLVLKKPLAKKNIWMDWRVVKFLTNYQYSLSEKELSLEDKMNLIKQAIQEEAKLEITYLKGNDTKSERTIKPFYVGKSEYMEKTFPSVEGYCFKRGENRVFRVDRILKMRKK